MAIEGFDYKEQYQGTGDTTAYSFSFYITDPSHLLIYIQDQFGNIVVATTGADPTWVSSVDTENGILNLAAVLQNAYTLTMLLANDEPDQPTDFPNKQSFTLDVIEGALDYLAACIQRVAYLAQRSAKLHDLDDVDSFDPTLPLGLGNFPGGLLQVNDAGSGFQIGPSYSTLIAEISASEAAAQAAQIEADNAAAGAVSALALAQTSANAASASAASAAASAASAALYAAVHHGPFASIPANSNANLLNETNDNTLYTMVDYIVRIQRGTTIFARQQFTIFYRNGAWELAEGPDIYANLDHGVTFTVNSTTGQINAAVANDGGANAVIDLYKVSWSI